MFEHGAVARWPRAILSRVVSGARAAIDVALKVLAQHLRIDWPIAIVIAVYLALFAPLIPRNADNPRMLAAFVNDEPFLTMALDGMLAKPYGNPGNYLDLARNEPERIPPHWLELRYYEITYYGGAPFQVAFPIYAALRALGAPPFPTAPIIMRLLSLLAGAASLIVLYNIARLRGFRAAGILAAVYMLCDPNFCYYVSIAHPDAPQLFFGLIAFACAAKHARDGDRASLVALGLFCGLVQGTKLGGPWMVPTAFAALIFGMMPARKHESDSGAAPRWRFADALGRMTLLGTAAIIAYAVSTPYAVFDPYYFKSLFSLFDIHTGSALQNSITLSSWAQAIADYVGSAGLVLLALTVLRAAWGLLRNLDRPLILALILALTQFLWFGLTGKLWHVVGYLLVAIGLMAVFAFEFLLLLGRKAVDALKLPASRGASIFASILPLSLICGLVFLRGSAPVNYALQLHLGQRDTVLSLNSWAVDGGIPAGSSVLFDDLAYLDPSKFPNAKMWGGILTWPVLDSFEPDFLILSGSLYNSANLKQLMQSQKLDRNDPQPYSVRLYQDLLRTETTELIGAPSVELVHTVRSVEAAEDLRLTIWDGDEKASPRQYVAAKLARASYRLRADFASFRQALGRSAQLISPRTSPVVGPELRVFRVHSKEWRRLRARATFASGTLRPYASRYAIDGTPTAWLCDSFGAAATACFIAADFGVAHGADVRKISVQWINGSATPAEFALEYSDDGLLWTEAKKLAVEPYAAESPLFRIDEFPVQSYGRHRYWRLASPKLLPGQYFGLAEFKFYESAR